MAPHRRHRRATLLIQTSTRTLRHLKASPRKLLGHYQPGLSTSTQVNDRSETLVTIRRLIFYLCDVAEIIEIDWTSHFHNGRCVPRRASTQRRLSSASRTRRRYSTFECRCRSKITCDNTGLIDVALGSWHLCDITVHFITNRWHT